MNCPMMTIGHVQKNAGPAWLRPTPKLPYVPVDTLMKLKAMAKFDRNPSVRRSSGLMPSDRSCASSRAATSWGLPGPDTDPSSYHRAGGASLTSGESYEDAGECRRASL